MKTQVLYRKASVDSKVAEAEIRKARPNSEIVEFETKIATAAEAKKARAAVGDLIYKATLKVAEFPDEGGESEEPPAPPAEEGGESEEKEESEPPSDDEGEDKPPKEEGPDDSVDDGPSHEPKELSPDEKIVHLLTQILDALQGGAGPELGGPKPPHHGPPGGGLGGPPGLDGPPPPPGGPGGLPPGGPPLPPPAKPAGPGGPTFAHYDPTQKTIDLIRKEAGELGSRALVAETELLYPTHRVAQLNRKGLATIDGLKVDLAENNLALLQLVHR